MFTWMLVMAALHHQLACFNLTASANVLATARGFKFNPCIRLEMQSAPGRDAHFGVLLVSNLCTAVCR
jgi:hypothetical protein